MGRRPLVDFDCTWRVDAAQQIYHRLEEVLRHLASEWIEETKHERWLWAETVWVSVSRLETWLCFRLLLEIRFTQSGWFYFTFSHQQRAAEDRRHTGSGWMFSLCETVCVAHKGDVSSGWSREQKGSFLLQLCEEQELFSLKLRGCLSFNKSGIKNRSKTNTAARGGIV